MNQKNVKYFVILTKMQSDIASTKQSVKWQVFRTFCNLMDHFEKLNDYSRTSLHVKKIYKYIHIFLHSVSEVLHIF